MRDFGTRSRHSFGGKGSNDDSPGKAFGIGKFCKLVYYFLNLYLFEINEANVPTHIPKHFYYLF